VVFIMDKIVFKDPILGSAFSEGIPRGSLVVFAGVPGVGKSVFIYNIVASLLKEGEKVVYTLFDEDPLNLASQLKLFNVNVDQFLEKETLILIDVFGASIPELESGLKIAATLTSIDPMECFRTIHRVIKEKGIKNQGLLVIDSLNEVILRYQPGIILDFIRNIRRLVKAYGLVCIATLHTGIPGLEQIYATIEYVSDCYVEFSFDPQLEELGIPLRRFRVKKLKGASHSLQWIPYTILRGGKISPVDLKSIVETVRSTMTKLRELTPQL